MMTKRAPMSGIIRVLEDAQKIGAAFNCTTLCERQKDNSHSNRQNNRNLIRRANEKGFLNPVVGPDKSIDYVLSAQGLNFLRDATTRLNENRAIAIAPVRTRSRRQPKVEKRQTLEFQPADLVSRVPNSVFSLGITNFSLPVDMNAAF